MSAWVTTHINLLKLLPVANKKIDSSFFFLKNSLNFHSEIHFFRHHSFIHFLFLFPQTMSCNWNTANSTNWLFCLRHDMCASEGTTRLSYEAFFCLLLPVHDFNLSIFTRISWVFANGRNKSADCVFQAENEKA